MDVYDGRGRAGEAAASRATRELLGVPIAAHGLRGAMDVMDAMIAAPRAAATCARSPVHA